MTDAHVIIAGDSNGLGFLNNGPAPYTPTARVQLWVDTDGDGKGDDWNYMNPGVNTGTLSNPYAWGPEVGIANQWLNDHPTGNLWIVKDAETVKGGTTLAIDWNPTSGAYFASTAHAASAAMHTLDGGPYAFDHYDVAFVVLGSNDAANHAYAESYAANLGVFDPAAREAWHVAELVMPRISDHVGTAEDNLLVRVAQWAVDQADPHMTSFKTIGYAMADDGIHYAHPDGFIALGLGSYDAWLL